MRTLLLATSIVAMSTAAFAGTLSGDQIKTTLIGNTMVGVQDGLRYEQYLDPSGKIIGTAEDGEYSGQWKITGNQMCFYNTSKSGDWDCSTVTLRKNQIIFEDGTTATLKKQAQ